MKLAQNLIQSLTKLPGVGPRAAQRLALHLLKNQSLAKEISQALQNAANQVFACATCGNLDASQTCSICADTHRLQTIICVVESVEDVWAMERTQEFRGLYHVLNGNLSARMAEQTILRIDALIQRAQNTNAQEIILALSSTFDGQTTGHIILKKLEKMDIQVSQIAQGVPCGTELDYMDKDTLTMALKGRRHFR